MSNYTLEYSPNAASNKAVLDHYLTLPIPENICQVTYVWFHGKIQAKTRTLKFVPKRIEEIPSWNAGLAAVPDLASYAQIYLTPVAMFKDPFLKGNNKLVLCETHNDDNTPTAFNKRPSCLDAMILEEVEESTPWFGIEQEYVLLGMDKRPLGWPLNGFPSSEIRHCGVGAENVCGRQIVDAHYRACLYAGIALYGTNPEVMVSQWEYQIGPCPGITIGDQLWMSRYILIRVAEDFGVIVSFDPKPVEGSWASSGVHLNYSTMAMREEGGITAIEQAVSKLKNRHLRHMLVYDQTGGRDNQRRLTGDPSHYNEFTSGIEDRHVSIRIPLQCAQQRKGYLEDRRPSSNCDPYSIVEAMVKTTIIDK